MSPNARPRDAKVMVSNLPLLFAKNDPTSLEHMSLEELQVFLRFMIKCEQNLTEVNIDSLPRPEWWPDNVNFEEKTLAQKEQRGRYSVLLRGVIRSCYTYHNCMYLLEFCRKLITFTGGVENLQVVDNCDGTRSLLNKVNKKLLVTFRAENQDYDKSYYSSKDVSASFHTKSPLKPSDSKRLGAASTSNASDPALSACVDVYLCDTCDKDFDSLEELIDHEKSCGKQEKSSSSSSKFPPRDKYTCDKFFSYLNLGRKNSSKVRKIKESDRPRATHYKDFYSIDICSPLGRYIVISSGLGMDKQAEGSRGTKTIAEYLKFIDDHSGTSKDFMRRHVQLAAGIGKYRFPGTNRGSNRRKITWSHSYCFNKAQRAMQMRVIHAGMSLPALRLWRKYNKKQPKITLKRLNQATVDDVRKREEEERQHDREMEGKRKREEEELEEKGNGGVEIQIHSSRTDMDMIPLLTPSVSSKQSYPLPSQRSHPSSSSHRSPTFSHSPPYASPRTNQASSSQKSVRSPLGSLPPGPWAKSSFMVRDEAHLEPEPNISNQINQTKPLIRVPRPLPELQRIAAIQPVVMETECIDLCSSDDE